MTLLLIIPAWILILSLIAGLCAAARLGDLGAPEYASASDTWMRGEPLEWEAAEHLTISAHASPRPARPAESGAPLVQAGRAAA